VLFISGSRVLFVKKPHHRNNAGHTKRMMTWRNCSYLFTRFPEQYTKMPEPAI